VVMPGCEEDLHQGFVLRCALKEFRDRYPSDVSWKYLSRLRWPEGARDIGYILRTVGDAMGLPSSAGQDEIERYIANYPRHLCFSHFVEGEDWVSDNGALVRAWCEYFARGDLGIRAQRLVVAFLCVQLATERTSACQALEGFLNELRTRYSGPAGNILVTGPLSQVRKKDVDDWTGEAARYLEEEYLEGSLLEIPSRLFGDQQPRSRCFRDVYIAVRSELDRLLINERPRFTSERA